MRAPPEGKYRFVAGVKAAAAVLMINTPTKSDEEILDLIQQRYPQVLIWGKGRVKDPMARVVEARNIIHKYKCENIILPSEIRGWSKKIK